MSLQHYSSTPKNNLVRADKCADDPCLLDPQRASTNERASLLQGGQNGDRTCQSAAATPPSKALVLMIKAFIGSGMLFVPRAFSNGGLLFSIFTLVLVALLSLHTMQQLASCYLQEQKRDQDREQERRCGNEYESRRERAMDRAASNVNTYSGLARAAFGWPLEYLVEFSITLSQLGFACANSVFVATSLRDSFNAVTDCKWSQELPLTAWVAIQALALCPLCLIRHVRGFSRVAIMADVAILLGLVYVLCMGALSLANNGYGENVQLFNKDGYLLFLGTAVYMFEGYALILPVGSALQKPEKLPSILNIVMVLCAAVAIAIGSTSYAAFGEQTQAIVIVNMPSTSVATQIVRVMYALAIIGTTPLMVFPIFQYFERLFYGNASGKQNIRVKVSKSLFRLALLGGVLYFAVVGSERLDRLVAIIGGAACVPLAFVYPPLIHLRLFSLRSSALRWQRLRNCAVAALGIGMCVFVTTSAVRRWGVVEAPYDFCKTRHP